MHHEYNMKPVINELKIYKSSEMFQVVSLSL